MLGGQRRIHHTAEAHDLLVEQIEHQLRHRVVQELELLLSRYMALPKHLRTSKSSCLVRPLTKSELSDLKQHATLATDTETTAAIFFSQTPQPECLTSNQLLESLAFFVGPINNEAPTFRASSLTAESNLLQPPRIPVYRARRLFPDHTQRDIVRSWLEKLSPRVSLRQPDENDVPVLNSDLGKDSTHLDTAYLIRNPRTMLESNIDTTSLAIALWRMRLWDGEGWAPPSS